MTDRYSPDDDMRAHARRVASEAPPPSPELLGKLRVILTGPGSPPVPERAVTGSETTAA